MSSPRLHIGKCCEPSLDVAHGLIHFQVDKGPNKNGRQAGFGPRLLSPFFYLLCSEVIKYCYFEAIALVHLYLDEFTQIAHWEVL